MRAPAAVVRFAGLGTALAASVVLLLFPAKAPASHRPELSALAWPKARTGSVAAKLADGTSYQPLMFLDATMSVGSAPSVNGRYLRLILRRADGTIRLLQQLPAAPDPSFGPVTAAGDVLAWATKNTATSTTSRLWTIGLRDNGAARLVTAATGSLVSFRSEDDLSIDNGRLYWEAADAASADIVHIRSVALSGGPVDDRAEKGAWQLTGWPWLADGAGTPSGTSLLRNLTTGQNVRVAGSGDLASTSCSPVWCQVATLADDGTGQVSLVHPDGTGRRRIAVTAVEPAITDVAPLNRFVVLAQAGPTTTLTHTGPLLVYEIARSKTVELSLDAANVSYAHGVLWWSNGNQDAERWHSIDLRTVTSAP